MFLSKSLLISSFDFVRNSESFFNKLSIEEISYFTRYGKYILIAASTDKSKLAILCKVFSASHTYIVLLVILFWFIKLESKRDLFVVVINSSIDLINTGSYATILYGFTKNGNGLLLSELICWPSALFISISLSFNFKSKTSLYVYVSLSVIFSISSWLKLIFDKNCKNLILFKSNFLFCVKYSYIVNGFNLSLYVEKRYNSSKEIFSCCIIFFFIVSSVSSI